MYDLYQMTIKDSNINMMILKLIERLEVTWCYINEWMKWNWNLESKKPKCEWDKKKTHHNGFKLANTLQWQCRAPLHECPKHHGHKGDLEMTPKTCGAVGERAQVILVWVKALGVGNAPHPWRLGVTRLKPWAMHSLWREGSRMLKNTSMGGLS